MRTRQTAQRFDAPDGYDGFGAHRDRERELSMDRDAAYRFRGAPHEPLRVHPELVHPLHPQHPPYRAFGVVGPEQEFGVVPPGFGPDVSWHQVNGHAGVGVGPIRHEHGWGPRARYGAFGDSPFEEAREGGDHAKAQELYRPHRGPHFGKGPRGFQRSDDRIRDEICERLARDGYIDASDVEVAVSAGVVRLFGSVHQVEDRHAVERVILDVYGVQEIRSELRLERKEAAPAGTSSEGGEQSRR